MTNSPVLSAEQARELVEGLDRRILPIGDLQVDFCRLALFKYHPVKHSSILEYASCRSVLLVIASSAFIVVSEISPVSGSAC